MEHGHAETVYIGYLPDYRESSVIRVIALTVQSRELKEKKITYCTVVNHILYWLILSAISSGTLDFFTFILAFMVIIILRFFAFQTLRENFSVGHDFFPVGRIRRRGIIPMATRLFDDSSPIFRHCDTVLQLVSFGNWHNE